MAASARHTIMCRICRELFTTREAESVNEHICENRPTWPIGTSKNHCASPTIICLPMGNGFARCVDALLTIENRSHPFLQAHSRWRPESPKHFRPTRLSYQPCWRSGSSHNATQPDPGSSYI